MASPGIVTFFRDGSSAFDAWTKAPTESQKSWMREHYDRMRAYSPYFDPRTAWYPNALVYHDAYAIYVGSEMALQHPDWILRDAIGAPLFIPYGAKPYKQYAADITNPAWSDDWIATAKVRLEAGYRGTFIDDVNYYRQVAAADGARPTPVGYAGELSEAAWQAWMGTFMAKVRTAIPSEIVHNSVWYVPETARVTYGLAQADYIEIEHGVNDPGVTGGTGKWALRSMLDWIDRRHAAGVGVIFDSQPMTLASRRYGLATYFLTSNGDDMLGTRVGGTPADWWTGYDVNLGLPYGDRERLPNGVLHRAFERGDVYVNEPGAQAVTVRGVTLGPAAGATLTS